MTPRLNLVEKFIYLVIIVLALLLVVLALASPEVFSGNKAVYQQF